MLVCSCVHLDNVLSLRDRVCSIVNLKAALQMSDPFYTLSPSLCSGETVPLELSDGIKISISNFWRILVAHYAPQLCISSVALYLKKASSPSGQPPDAGAGEEDEPIDELETSALLVSWQCEVTPCMTHKVLFTSFHNPFLERFCVHPSCIFFCCSWCKMCTVLLLWFAQDNDQLRTPRQAGMKHMSPGEEQRMLKPGHATVQSYRRQTALEELLYFLPSNVNGKLAWFACSIVCSLIYTVLRGGGRGRGGKKEKRISRCPILDCYFCIQKI